MTCTICEGAGCDECKQTGNMLITECGRKATRHLVSAVNMAMHAAKGTLPVAGGILDQSAWFVALWNAFDNDMAMIRKEDSE